MSQTKHIYNFLALLLILLCFSGCDSNEIKEVKPDGVTLGITPEDFQKGYNQFADSLGYAEITEISESKPPLYTSGASSEDMNFSFFLYGRKIYSISFNITAEKDSDFKHLVGVVSYIDPTTNPDRLIEKLGMRKNDTIVKGLQRNIDESITYKMLKQYNEYQFVIYP